MWGNVRCTSFSVSVVLIFCYSCFLGWWMGGRTNDKENCDDISCVLSTDLWIMRFVRKLFDLLDWSNFNPSQCLAIKYLKLLISAY